MRMYSTSRGTMSWSHFWSTNRAMRAVSSWLEDMDATLAGNG